MKQIIYSIFGICLLLTVASCSKDGVNESWIPEDAEGLVFKATIEADSKAFLNTASMIVEWEDDDEITIVDAVGTRVLYVATKDPGNAKKAILTKKPVKRILWEKVHTQRIIRHRSFPDFQVEKFITMMPILTSSPFPWPRSPRIPVLTLRAFSQ